MSTSKETAMIPATPKEDSAKSASTFACIPCQQRKVKCDRNTPCSQCVRKGVDCKQAPAGPRRRRRRFGEGALLTRLRQYEALLKSNGIKFEPMHPGSGQDVSTSKSIVEGDEVALTLADRAPTTTGGGGLLSSIPPSHVDSTESDESGLDDDQPDDDLVDHNARQDVVKSFWELYKDNDHLLLLGAQSTGTDLAVLHPSQGHVFKLWQIYLENVDPLLKVTHTPTLQPRVLEAATHLRSLTPVMESLLFGIYCVAIISLTDNQCLGAFGQARDDLLGAYLFGAQQALLRSKLLQTSDRECLTAFYFYLIAIRPQTDSRSLSAMLGCAVRTAQRLGYDCERSVSYGNSILEAELRRRLWWSLVSFDARQFEMADYRSPARISAWTCKLPLNVNDSELRPQMNAPPATYGRATDVLFALVRSEVTAISYAGTTAHEVYNPDDATPSKAANMGERLSDGMQTIESTYLQYCDPHNPLHAMTIWMSRAFMAKKRLIEHMATSSKSSHRTDRRNIGMSYALYMLQCDTKLISSIMITGYFWFLDMYFPGFAYISACQSLRQHPLQEHADRAWAIMSDNYQHRFRRAEAIMNPLIRAFSGIVVSAWDARLAAAGETVPDEPSVVTHCKTHLQNTAYEEDPMDIFASLANLTTFPDTATPSSASHDTPRSTTTYQNAMMVQGKPVDVLDEQWMMGLDMEHFDWTLLDWNSMDTQ